MGCCSDYVSLGCADYCAELDTGYNATQTGVHYLEVQFMAGVVDSISLGSVSSGGDLVIPAGALNESKQNDIKILQPDGTYYEFDTDIFCIRINTYIST